MSSTCLKDEMHAHNVIFHEKVLEILFFLVVKLLFNSPSFKLSLCMAKEKRDFLGFIKAIQPTFFVKIRIHSIRFFIRLSARDVLKVIFQYKF